MPLSLPRDAHSDLRPPPGHASQSAMLGASLRLPPSGHSRVLMRGCEWLGLGEQAPEVSFPAEEPKQPHVPAFQQTVLHPGAPTSRTHSGGTTALAKPGIL